MAQEKFNMKKVLLATVIVIGAILLWNNAQNNTQEESSCEKDFEMRVEQMKKEYLEKNKLVDRTPPADWEERKLYEPSEPQEDNC